MHMASAARIWVHIKACFSSGQPGREGHASRAREASASPWRDVPLVSEFFITSVVLDTDTHIPRLCQMAHDDAYGRDRWLVARSRSPTFGRALIYFVWCVRLPIYWLTLNLKPNFTLSWRSTLPVPPLLFRRMG